MRDVHDVKAPIFRGLYHNGVLVNGGTSNQQRYRSYRFDSVSTDPLPSGTYHEVTNYGAFFSNVEFTPGRCDVQQWMFPGWRTYELRWDGPEQPPWWAGCDRTSLLPTPPNSMVAQVRARMMSQIRDDLDISTFAGEARETASMLAQVLRKLLVIAKNVSRLRPRGNFGGWSNATVGEARKAAKQGSRTASSYLMYMYGVKPLINDVMKIANHWDERMNAPVSREIYASAEGRISLSLTPYQSVEGKLQQGVTSGAYVHVDDPQLFRAYQYGLTSPLSLAWELTTLSFVVDWFTGIGSFIQGLESPMGVSIRDLYETKWVDANFTYIYDYGLLYPPPYWRTDVGKAKAKAQIRIKAMIRNGSPSLLIPPIYFNLGVNSSQVLSIIALIVARMK